MYRTTTLKITNTNGLTRTILYWTGCLKESLNFLTLRTMFLNPVFIMAESVEREHQKFRKQQRLPNSPRWSSAA